MTDQQSWVDEVQQIVSTFVQNDHELGELMLDHSERYWDQCFTEGLSPQQAADRFITTLKTSNLLERYKKFKTRNENDFWWVSQMRQRLIALSEIAETDEEGREAQEIEIQLLIDSIVARYRDASR
jgi:hypothetical protein